MVSEAVMVGAIVGRAGVDLCDYCDSRCVLGSVANSQVQYVPNLVARWHWYGGICSTRGKVGAIQNLGPCSPSMVGEVDSALIPGSVDTEGRTLHLDDT